MTEIMQEIYTFARENVIPTYLAGQEYEKRSREVERKEEGLLKFLPADRRRQMEEYFSEVGCRTSIELEAAFQAGFALGQELSRT